MSEKNGSLRLVVKVAVVLALLVALAWLALNNFRATALVASVKRADAVDIVTGSLTVFADKNLQELKSELPGRVVSCEALDPAKDFKKGDVLVELDATDLQRTKDQAMRDFESAQRRLEVPLLEKADWKAAKEKLDEALRQQKLGNASAADVAKLQGELDTIARLHLPRRIAAEEALAKAERYLSIGNAAGDQVRDARRALEAIDLELKLADFDRAKGRIDFESGMEAQQRVIDKMKIRAPVDGLVQGVTIAPGSLIAAGAVVATYYQNARIVVGKVSEDNFSKIRVGQLAKVRLQSFGTKEFDAKISKVLPFADADTQRYTVYLDVAVDSKELIPNGTGEMTITVGEHPNQPLIPRRALTIGNHVYVVKDGRVEKRSVEVGFVGLNLVEVREKLAPGEQVIVENLDEFRDGQRVRTTAID